MTNGTRYIETATGLEVTLDSTFEWGVHPPQHFIVRYPDGRAFVTPRAVITRHFTIVTPQNIDIGRVWSGDINRPTKEQCELDAELDSQRATIPG